MSRRCVESVSGIFGSAKARGRWSLAVKRDLKSVRGSKEAKFGYEGKRKVVEYSRANIDSRAPERR